MPFNTNLPRRSTTMSPKEQAVLTLLARGYDAAEIARVLDVSRNYVYSLIRLLKARFSASTIAGVVSAAIDEGAIEPDGTCRDGEERTPDEEAESGDAKESDAA